MSDEQPVLSVRDLTVRFPVDGGAVTAVAGLSFDVFPNEVLGVVGESGSGKTTVAHAVMGLLPASAIVGGEVVLGGTSLLGARERELEQVRGRRIALVFQDASSALDPVYRVGDQVAEAVRVHQRIDGAALRDRVVELLDVVGIPDPARLAERYPHEYSGGMRQRAMIAIAMANDPDVLVADEPTSALDVTIQAQVLEVLRRVQARTRAAIVLITHDLGVIAGTADRVMVMYAGRAAEVGPVDAVFYESQHPYTLGLLASLPRMNERRRGRKLYQIDGQPPAGSAVPTGCAFHPRCAFAEVPGPCSESRPALAPVEGREGHAVACHRAAALVGVTPESLREGS